MRDQTKNKTEKRGIVIPNYTLGEEIFNAISHGIGALLSVAALLRAIRAARDVLITDRENTPLLRERAELLTEARNVERDITDAILSEDEIAALIAQME